MCTFVKICRVWLLEKNHLTRHPKLLIRLIAILAEDQPMNRGVNIVNWHGTDMHNKTCPSGLYVVIIQAENKKATKTVIVMNR